MRTQLHKAACDMRKMVRVLNQPEPAQILDILEQRCLDRFTDIVDFSDCPSVYAVRSQAYIWSSSCPVAYQDMLELAYDDACIDSGGSTGGELVVHFKEQVDFMGVPIIVELTARCPVPEDDLMTLRALGKAKWQTPNNKPYETFVC